MSNIKTGDILNFDYTGAVQSITLTPGKYKLECWGAQGGDGTNYSSTGLPYTGGKGGYSSGILNIIDSGTLYIVCGSAGSTVANISNTYNGGGGSGNTNYQAGSGGGATHIGLKEGLLTTFSSDYASKLLLVAGGGGGGKADMAQAGAKDPAKIPDAFAKAAELLQA